MSAQLQEQIIVEERVTYVEVVGEETIEIVEETVAVIEVGVQGPAGPAGGGVASGFEQSFGAALSWVVNHNLGKYPLVTALTIGGAEVEAEIIHSSVNQFTVYFTAPLSGSVRCL